MKANSKYVEFDQILIRDLCCARNEQMFFYLNLSEMYDNKKHQYVEKQRDILLVYRYCYCTKLSIPH